MMNERMKDVLGTIGTGVGVAAMIGLIGYGAVLQAEEEKREYEERKARFTNLTTNEAFDGGYVFAEERMNKKLEAKDREIKRLREKLEKMEKCGG